LNLCFQGGNLDPNDCTITGGYSTYGEKFEDENFELLHDKAGLLSMVQCRGPDNGNTSCFYIDLKRCPHLDGKNVIFGQVVAGMEVCRTLEGVERETRETGRMFHDMQYGNHAVWPKEAITIVNCGEVDEATVLDLVKQMARDPDQWPTAPADAMLEKPWQLQQASDEIKQAGNALFKLGQATEALVKYNKALAYLEHAKSTIDFVTRVPIMLNRAACFLQLGEYMAAFEECNNVLVLQPDNSKALYRRVKVLLESDIVYSEGQSSTDRY